MSRIDSSGKTPDSSVSTSIDRIAPEVGKMVPLPLDVIDKEQLITMMSVMRRPPGIPLNEDRKSDAGFSDGVLPSDLEPVLEASANELAYKITSLIIRREQEISGQEDTNLLQGFKELETMVRMFEHLHLVRTAPPGI